MLSKTLNLERMECAMKQLYDAPELEVNVFLTDDVMTASFGDNDLADPWN